MCLQDAAYEGFAVREDWTSSGVHYSQVGNT